MHNRFSLFLILPHTPFTSPGPKGLWGMNRGYSLGGGGPTGGWRAAQDQRGWPEVVGNSTVAAPACAFPAMPPSPALHINYNSCF